MNENNLKYTDMSHQSYEHKLYIYILVPLYSCNLIIVFHVNYTLLLFNIIIVCIVWRKNKCRLAFSKKINTDLYQTMALSPFYCHFQSTRSSIFCQISSFRF